MGWIVPRPFLCVSEKLGISDSKSVPDRVAAGLPGPPGTLQAAGVSLSVSLPGWEEEEVKTGDGKMGRVFKGFTPLPLRSLPTRFPPLRPHVLFQPPRPCPDSENPSASEERKGNVGWGGVE